MKICAFALAALLGVPALSAAMILMHRGVYRLTEWAAHYCWGERASEPDIMCGSVVVFLLAITACAIVVVESLNRKSVK